MSFVTTYDIKYQVTKHNTFVILGYTIYDKRYNELEMVQIQT